MSVYDYVKLLADERNEAISDVEKASGLGNGTIKSWTISFPKVDKLYGVALHFNVDLEYFLTGKRNDMTQQERTLLEIFRNISELDKFEVITLCMELKKKTEKEKTDSSKESAV